MKKKIQLILLTLILACANGFAQTAKQVLDKAAATVSYAGGVSAHFTTSGSYGTNSGTIAVKGRKFHATTAMATIWFDGKTQWTYMKRNNEVNVNNPTESQLQAINPYNFINMYRSGYKYTMKTVGNKYEVHLTATQRRGVSEMYIVVDKTSYVPSQIRMKQNKGWSTISISRFKKSNLSDSMFRFNAKDFPSAEVIDLR